MLRSFVCLLLTVAFASAGFAQVHHDIQSLQYEFGRSAAQVVPYSPVACPPVVRCCAPVYPMCSPYYMAYSVPRYYPAPKVYRRVHVRPAYVLPYYYGW